MSGIPINSGTGPSVAAVASGTDYIQVVTVASGSMSISNTPTVTVGNTVTISGTVGALTTGTVNVVNVLSASGITVASLATGTMNVVNVLSAANVTVASVATGTMNVVNTVAISGTVSAGLITTTASIAVVSTAHASRFQAFVIATTSAAGGVVVKTSGAHTLYITDILLNVGGTQTVQLCSETTALAAVVLAANGGWAQDFTQPLVCNSAQSLRVIMSSSGTCNVTAIGFTVT